MIAIKDSDGEQLTRRVLTFRQFDGVTRRDEEVHTLELYDREDCSRFCASTDFAYACADRMAHVSPADRATPCFVAERRSSRLSGSVSPRSPWSARGRQLSRLPLREGEQVGLKAA